MSTVKGATLTSAFSSCFPWEKLSRKTSTPATNNASICSNVRDAGPSVATWNAADRQSNEQPGKRGSHPRGPCKRGRFGERAERSNEITHMVPTQGEGCLHVRQGLAEMIATARGKRASSRSNRAVQVGGRQVGKLEVPRCQTNGTTTQYCTVFVLMDGPTCDGCLRTASQRYVAG